MLGFFKRPLVVAKVVVTNDQGQILVIRRSRHILRPGTWDLPGGIVDPGERPKVTAARETQEETGLEVHPQLLDVGANTESDHSVAIIYRAKVGQPRVKLSWEHDDFRWVEPAELAALGISQKYLDAVKILK